MDMYTLLYVKWITSKDLLYSTGNSAYCCGSLDGRGVWGLESPMDGGGWWAAVHGVARVGPD